ncbi:hypothetical protein DFP74_2881 [Nocardiopsis sp. Huas11]|uniref:hypothetical protein n=1 Tax=Nocardiopsis sp. Huas11 TaxID=2183912 RepID=UPI000EAB5B4F|nr:hypothetical protein [Nocardiopsis sp. Huas11]RKS07219.1 hypothetical protein DFP74_2881 [Nocardiopsis sp. Huas11]
MSASPDDRPSETEQLRQRLQRLEARFHAHTYDAERLRAATALLTAGMVIALLSRLLPWASDESWVPSGDDTTLSAVLLWVGLAALAGGVVRYLLRPSRFLLGAVVALACVPPALLLVEWAVAAAAAAESDYVSDVADPQTGRYFLLMVLGCAVVGGTAAWLLREERSS